MSRIGRHSRKTLETEVTVEINIDEPGTITIDTPYRFFNHLLETLLHYARFSGLVRALELKKVDDHHVIEDVAICLGEAIRNAIASSKIARFGWCIIPMDDALVLVAVDLCGRPYLSYKCRVTRSTVGDIAVENVKHFFYTLAVHLGATLHVKVLDGENAHHILEAMFKAVGIALHSATREVSSVISTKGHLDLDVVSC